MASRARSAVAALLIGGLVAGTPAVASDRAPRAAIEAAKAKARKEFRGGGIFADFSLRSQVDRRWALVTGGGKLRGVWAVWVRRRSDGRWTARVYRSRNFYPRGYGIPCDLIPAFSEPSC